VQTKHSSPSAVSPGAAACEFDHVLDKEKKAEAISSSCLSYCITRDQVRDIASNNWRISDTSTDFIPGIAASGHERSVSPTNEIKRTCYLECGEEG
jgi:hypothetical protein